MLPERNTAGERCKPNFTLAAGGEPAMATYLSRNRSSSAVLSLVLIGGRVEDGCGGKERGVVRAGAQPCLGARAWSPVPSFLGDEFVGIGSSHRPKEKTMARPPMFSVQEKQRIVLSVLRGECSVAEAARRNKCSETSIAKWRDQFVQAGVSALEAGAARGPSARETQLERQLEEARSALGEAHVRLWLAEREGAGFASRSWR
jgi:transposase